MDAEWITSPAARRILAHWADSRAAWLWSADGSVLLWRNSAARLFNGKVKKSGVRLAAEPAPIKGQVARLIRLGSVGRSSLARVQFLAGDRPAAITCSCTPLPLAGGETALLLVAVDPIEADLRETAADLQPDAITEALFPAGWSYRIADGDTSGPGEVAIKAGPGDEILLLSPSGSDAASIATVRSDEGVETEIAAGPAEEDRDLADMPEPMLPMGIPPLPETPSEIAPTDAWLEPLPADVAEPGPLTSLFDRLADAPKLYTPLTAADETFDGPPPSHSADSEIAIGAEASQPAEADMIATVIAEADLEPGTPPQAPEQPEQSDDPTAPPLPETKSHWLITGRGFRALTPRPPHATEDSASIEPPPEAAPEAPPPAAAPAPKPEAEAAAAPASIADADSADRVTRYNFEELGRILTDRVAGDQRAEPEAPPADPAATAPNAIINLNAETLVLNRLPLAILVFRDQQVLFANRALTDLLGHESVESLRTAGIASIFPAEDPAHAGPVNRLVRRDGALLDVTARLQSVSWQGRAALMLSASVSEPVRGHEGAVRAFAETAAQTRGDGYITADRAGIVTFVSAPGCTMLARTEAELAGRPIAVLVARADMEALRGFLERPARFAETARPAFSGLSESGDAEITLFAEGQAGIVSGYFGFIRPRATDQTVSSPAPQDGVENGILGRVSRGIRRPLNTIIGFADLIGSAAAGDEREDRTAEYARDIRTAGLEIAVLADELDDYTRLQEGNYAARPSDVDLAALLESCIVRVRPQAGAARVLVRSAISERLPSIRADRSSLGQALLNLLASAIDQTPIGGSVILSAQFEEDGAIAIHVRDGAQGNIDPGEHFVVFRDGSDAEGGQLAPVHSSVGLALTRSLLAVNACSLSVDPTPTTGTLFSLTIPADAVIAS